MEQSLSDLIEEAQQLMDDSRLFQALGQQRRLQSAIERGEMAPPPEKPGESEGEGPQNSGTVKF